VGKKLAKDGLLWYQIVTTPWRIGQTEETQRTERKIEQSCRQERGIYLTGNSENYNENDSKELGFIILVVRGSGWWLI
jgi:hypothetical protein